MHNIINNAATASKWMAVAALPLLLFACKGRTADNMEPSGETIQVVIQSQQAPSDSQLMEQARATAQRVLQEGSLSEDVPAENQNAPQPQSSVEQIQKQVEKAASASNADASASNNRRTLSEQN